MVVMRVEAVEDRKRWRKLVLGARNSQNNKRHHFETLIKIAHIARW